MGFATADRFIHYVCTPSPRDWLNWAELAGIHPAVMTMIKTKPDHLINGFDVLSDTSDNKIIPTPRSWSVVSDMMYEIGADNELLKVMVPGVIGTATAQEFFFVINSSHCV